jgi:hypothetical protein
MDDRIYRRNELIKAQKQLIDLFDMWVALVKNNELAAAKNIKELSMTVRKKVYDLEDDIKKENKLITKLN